MSGLGGVGIAFDKGLRDSVMTVDSESKTVSQKRREYQTGKDLLTGREKRYYFFLNPYVDCAFTRCPKCDGKTRVRMFCLFIHVDPQHLLSFNKLCKFCPACDLIIVKKRELESYLAETFEKFAPDAIGNKYLVVGTLDRKSHRKGKKGGLAQAKALDLFVPFHDHLNFEINWGGWRPEGKENSNETR